MPDNDSMDPTTISNPTDTAEAQPATRDRSTIEFPYQSLDEAVLVAKAVHLIGGQSCQIDQLAAQLKQTATGGAFRMRVLTAKGFGLVSSERGTVIINLTPMGSRICDPKQEAMARAEAFLEVPLYKAIYDKFRGTTLPPPGGLETVMATLGVTQKQKGKARQIFQKSANEAGFFKHGIDRLVMPSGTGSDKLKDEDEKTIERRADTAGDQIKTVSLPNVGGSLTISGTFNVFELDGDERQLVFAIVDMMKTFEKKTAKQNDSAS